MFCLSIKRFSYFKTLICTLLLHLLIQHSHITPVYSHICHRHDQHRCHIEVAPVFVDVAAVGDEVKEAEAGEERGRFLVEDNDHHSEDDVDVIISFVHCGKEHDRCENKKEGHVEGVLRGEFLLCYQPVDHHARHCRNCEDHCCHAIIYIYIVIGRLVEDLPDARVAVGKPR